METAHQFTDHLNDTLSSAKDGLEKGIHQTSERVHDVAQKVKEYGQQADNPTVEKYAEEVGEKLQEGAEYIQSKDLERLTQDLKELLENTIRQRPLVSISVALGTGFVLARLFSRR